MAEPTTKFRLIPQSIAVAALDTSGKRLAAISGESEISTGSGNEADFGTIDISGGAADSNVLTMLWNVTANGGNTLVETFKLWMSSNGFDQVDTVCKARPLMGDDGTPSGDIEKYKANAGVSDYTFSNMVESEPGAINVWPTDKGTSMSVAGGASDDAILWAMYLSIASGETTGEYSGLSAGMELQFSHKFSYS